MKSDKLNVKNKYFKLITLITLGLLVGFLFWVVGFSEEVDFNAVEDFGSEKYFDHEVVNYDWERDDSGNLVLKLNPRPLRIKIDEEWVLIEDEFSDVSHISKEEANDPGFEISENDRKKALQYHDLIDRFKSPNLKGEIILHTEDESVLEDVKIRGRNQKDKELEKEREVEHPYHFTYIDGAEDLSGEIAFPKDTYSDVYVVRDGQIKDADYEVVNGRTYIQMDKFSGAGTSEDPWEVHNFEDLKKVGSGVDGWDLDSYYNLEDNIDATSSKDLNGGMGFEPIGPESEESFDGVFNGQGYTISNLHIDRGEETGVGLFGVTGDDAEISNFSIDGAEVVGYEYVGGVVGLNNGLAEDINFSGDVLGMSTTELRGGGLAGANQGVINRCYAEGTVESDDLDENGYSIGGLVGDNRGTITESRTDSFVIGPRIVGGLVGYNAGPLQRSFSKGWVEAPEDRVGGLVGSHADDTVVDSYSEATVRAGTGAGGLVGVTLGAIENSYSVGYIDDSIAYDDDLGGLVGRITTGGGPVDDSFWDVETSETDWSEAGTGLTTDEMQDYNTFTGAGWDIETYSNHSNQTWYIENGSDYPRLAWEEDIPTLEVETDFVPLADESSATLRGLISEVDDTASAYFKYRERGTDPWTQSDPVERETGYYEDNISLDSDKRYEYKAVAESEGEIDEGEVVNFSTKVEKFWETDDDWSESTIDQLDYEGGVISLGHFSETETYNYDEHDSLSDGAGIWETYYQESSVNVENMDEMEIGYDYELGGESHNQGDSYARVRFLIDGTEEHFDESTDSVANTWTGGADVSGKDTVSIEVQFYSEEGSRQAGASSVDIYWAEYEYFVDSGYYPSGEAATQHKAIITSSPTLVADDYSLNGQTIAVTVTGSPGMSDEESSEPLTLDGGTFYDLNWDNNHTYFSINIEMSTDSDASPELSSIGLQGEPPETTEPSVSTSPATEVTDNSATLQGELTDTGNDDQVEVYFEWGFEGGELSNTTPAQSMSFTDPFEQDIDNLDSGTAYEFRAVAENSAGDSRGDVLSFTTDQTYSLTVDSTTGGSASDVTNSSPYSSGEVVDISASPDTGYEFVEWTAPAGTFDDSTMADTNFTMPDEDVTITANFQEEVVAPIVDTNEATGVEASQATFNGELTDLGGDDSVDVHFEWGTSETDLSNTTESQQLTTADTFDETISELTEGTTYYFKAVAENDSGTNTDEGDVLSFTTDQTYSLTVDSTTGGSASDVTNSSPYSSGEVVDISASPDEGYEFVGWTAPAGTFDDPEMTDTVFTMPDQDVIVTANFEEAVDELSVLTSSATEVESDSAILQGELVSLGDADSADVWFEWGLSETDLPNTTEAQQLSAADAFNQPISELTEEENYYFRAVADSGSEQETGEVLSFFTGDEKDYEELIINYGGRRIKIKINQGGLIEMLAD